MINTNLMTFIPSQVNLWSWASYKLRFKTFKFCLFYTTLLSLQAWKFIFILTQTYQSTEQPGTLQTLKTAQRAEGQVTIQQQSLKIPTKASKILGLDVTEAQAPEHTPAVAVDTETADLTTARPHAEKQISEKVGVVAGVGGAFYKRMQLAATIANKDLIL